MVKWDGRTAVLIAMVIGGVAAGGRTSQAQQVGEVDFARDVLPILQQRCYECHGEEQQKNGFRLDRRSDAMRGGTIAMIGPGNSEGSRLYHRLVGDRFGRQMPPDGALPASQIAILKAWIDQGAEWPDEHAGEVPPPAPDAAATAIMQALVAGDRARFERLVAGNHRAVNRKGPGGATPLMNAVLYGDAAAVRTLIECGADPNIADHGGATALMWAVTDTEKTRMLLEAGANVNARSSLGRTPLAIAAGIPGATPVVKLLLDRGANPSVKVPGLFGDLNPLILAAYNGDESTFRLLVERGADLKAAGVPALALSLRARCGSCVETMLKQLAPEQYTATMVMAAPPRGPALATAMLLKLGADPNARDPEGRTMLMLAAASDALPTDIVRMLIEKGADVNARSQSGETALQLAKLRGGTDITRLLLAAGAKDEALPAAPSNFAPVPSARAAVERSLPLLQRTDAAFLAKSGCVSCHNNTLTAMSVAAARARGVRVDEGVASAQATKIASYLGSWRDRALQGIAIPGDADTVSYILLGLAAEQRPPDRATDAMARLLKMQQRPEGFWRPLAHRPPIESSEIQVTAMSMRSLQVYAPATERTEYQEAIARAAAWIASSTPHSTEDRTFQLLGLHWSNGSRTAIVNAGRELLAEQRGDGGWAQLPSLASDAYATGQALYALAESGAIPVTDPAFTRGVDFLLRTQFADGSWFVRTRALPIQPHFESGFPHGRNQFISAAATNWAVLALTRVEGRSAAD